MNIYEGPGEFLQACPSGRLLGIDVGRARIGVAVSDALRCIASPHGVSPFLPWDGFYSSLEQKFQGYGLQGIVVGKPLSLRGHENTECMFIRTWLREGLRSNLPVLLWDERFSTNAAYRAMEHAPLSLNKKKKHIDGIAASYILQGFLEWCRNNS